MAAAHVVPTIEIRFATSRDEMSLDGSSGICFKTTKYKHEGAVSEELWAVTHLLTLRAGIETTSKTVRAASRRRPSLWHARCRQPTGNVYPYVHVRFDGSSVDALRLNSIVQSRYG